MLVPFARDNAFLHGLHAIPEIAGDNRRDCVFIPHALEIINADIFFIGQNPMERIIRKFATLGRAYSVSIQAGADLREGPPCGVFLKDSNNDRGFYRVYFIRPIRGLF